MREARTAGDGHQAVYSSGGFSPIAAMMGFTGQRDDRHFDHGRFADDGFLLCDGEKHGIQRRVDQQRGHAGDGAFLCIADAVDFPAAAVRAAVTA